MAARHFLFLASLMFVVGVSGRIDAQQDTSEIFIGSELFDDESLSDDGETLKSLNGKWKPTSSISVASVSDESKLSEKFLNKVFTADFITIEGNQLLPYECYDFNAAALTVDFSAGLFRPVVKTPLANGRLIMITTEDGKSTFLSFNVSENSLSLRYPAGCCSRSGCVVTYARVNDE